MKSKRQTTKAKLARERLVQERRTLKRERKQAAARGETDAVSDTQAVEGEIPSEPLSDPTAGVDRPVAGYD